MTFVDKKQYWPFLLVIPLILAAVAGWFLLPEELIMQIGIDGQPSRVMAKPFGLLVPIALGMIGAGIACNTDKERKVSGFIVLAVAAIVTIFNFAWNL